MELWPWGLFPLTALPRIHLVLGRMTSVSRRGFPARPAQCDHGRGRRSRGQVTLNEKENIRNGVTRFYPWGQLVQEKVAGAVFVGNAFGKLAGSTQVEELGTFETPSS